MKKGAAGNVFMMPTITELVDQLGAVEAELDSPAAVVVLAKQKKAEALRKALRERVDAAPDESVELWGTQFMAQVGPRENQTKILSMESVYRLVKKAPFLEACTMTLKALEQLVPNPLTRAKLIQVERTGSRPVSTHPIRDAAAKAQAAA